MSVGIRDLLDRAFVFQICGDLSRRAVGLLVLIRSWSPQEEDQRSEEESNEPSLT